MAVQKIVRVDFHVTVLGVATQDAIPRDGVSVMVGAVIYFRIADVKDLFASGICDGHDVIRVWSRHSDRQ